MMTYLLCNTRSDTKLAEESKLVNLLPLYRIHFKNFH